jgi:hypothetical protein
MSGQLSVISDHELTTLTCAVADGESLALLDQHLATCPVCRHRLAFFRGIASLSSCNGHQACMVWLQVAGDAWHVVAITARPEEHPQ